MPATQTAWTVRAEHHGETVATFHVPHATSEHAAIAHVNTVLAITDTAPGQAVLNIREDSPHRNGLTILSNRPYQFPSFRDAGDDLLFYGTPEH